ncbi:hypothetical protein AAX27_01234 [Aliarcobacter thereius]|nr:hypothetical protein AAX27_01234 [Aliarcobacter thereius]
MIEKINQKNLEFQEALSNQNHKKALEVRDEYLNLTQTQSHIKHNYLRELIYFLEESNDLELLIKYYDSDTIPENQKYFLRNKIAKLYISIDYEKALEYSKDDEIKYLVAKEIAKKDFTKAQVLIDEIDNLSFYYGYLVFTLVYKNFDKNEIEELIKDLDIAKEQRKIRKDTYVESLLKIAFESFEKYPDISQNILDRFKNSLEVPSDILDLQVLIAVKKSKDDFTNIPKYIEEIDDLDFIKAKVILQIVDFYKDDIDKVIESIFISIDKFYSDAIKYETIYNIQKVTNKNYSQELKELSKNINLDDDSISFDNEIWFGFLVEKLNG